MYRQSPVHDGRRAVLLIEDDPAVRRSLQLLLRSRGLEVRAHGSSRAVLADPAAMDAALLVADFRLGDGDGVQILESLRQKGWVGPAVLVTGFASDQLEARARNAGFSLILKKPLVEGAFADTVERLLR
ncbi:response regulator [Caulobacter sp. 1776]|uniref:response regulator n=1 Tax=Caulobacter sp. 1776 TaxID=3156420 RepID=UPI003396E5D7